MSGIVSFTRRRCGAVLTVMARSQTIAGLTLRWAALRKRPAIGCLVALLMLVAWTCALCGQCARAPSPRVVTFNIRDFPESQGQIEGAFELLDDLDAPIIAVQEITHPPMFARAARERLGAEYRFVHDDGAGLHHLGVLYDSDEWTLSFSRAHDEVRITPNGKPALEVRLRRNAGGAVRVFVVHLKAGGEYSEIRREQLRQLAAIVLPVVEGTWDDVLVLGDLNATGPEDRRSLAWFARATHLVWASERLACTSYWDRDDGCRGSALDHVFTRRVPREIAARGPCEEIGCAPRDECPTFHREVSDHCPVTIDP
jgi:endonuclease/exonuclease/phosphatase family metal-dependent hydrolase